MTSVVKSSRGRLRSAHVGVDGASLIAEPRRGDYHSFHNPENFFPPPRLNLPDRLQGQIMGGRGRSGGGRRERKRTEFAGEGVERGGAVSKEAWIRALGDRTFFEESVFRLLGNGRFPS